MVTQDTAGGNKRQRIILIGVLLVGAFLVWQVFGMFSGGSSETPPVQAAPTQPPPQPATLATIKKEELTPRELELMQMQKETEAKYIAALNELQMLKVEKDIAETNKAIAAAKLDTVTSQKGVVEMLTGPAVPPPNYAQALGGASATAPQQGAAAPAVVSPAVTYTVISVSQIHYKWNAVLGYQGNLYSVAIGDVLPPDGSKVISIGKSGVTLEKGGIRTQVSLVPII